MKFIRDLIKEEGFTNVIIGLSQKISKIDKRTDERIDSVNKRIEDLQNMILDMNTRLTQIQMTLHNKTTSQLQDMIRSVEGLNLVKFETQDVYIVNKRIEQLQREIKEIKNMNERIK